MKTFCLCLVLVAAGTLSAQQFNSSFTHDGTSPVKGIGYDDLGNLYTAAALGYTSSGVVYPGPDNNQPFNLNDRGFVITRHAPDGSLEWIKGIAKGATNHNQGLILEDMHVTGSGDLFLTGWFKNEVDFDPGTGQQLRQAEDTQGWGNADNDNAFLLKLSSAGEFQWVRTWRGFGVMGVTCTVAADGSIYVGGISMGSEIDLNPGTGSHVVSNAYFSLTMGWLVKLNAFGEYQWGHALAVDPTPNTPFLESVGFSGLVTDSLGNVYLGGFVRTTNGAGELRILTEGTPHPSFPSVGTADILLISYDAAGNRRWVKVLGHGPNGTGNQAWALAVDDEDELYVTGGYSQQVDFDPPNNQTTLGNHGNQGIFLLKLSGAGQFRWVREFISDYSNAFSQCIVADHTGVIIAGGFGGVIDLDPGAAQELHDAGDGNGFMLKLNKQGQHLWSRNFGTTDFSGGGFGIDPLPQTGGRVMAMWNYRIALGGHFRETADFNPGGTGGVHHSPNAPKSFVMITDQPYLLSALAIHHDPLPDTLADGAAAQVNLWASGGTGVGYEWSITAGALPPGFSLEHNPPRITGTMQQEGMWDFTLHVRDDIGNYTELPLHWQLQLAQVPPGNGNGTGNGTGDNGGGSSPPPASASSGGGCAGTSTSGVWALALLAGAIGLGRRRLVPKR